MEEYERMLAEFLQSEGCRQVREALEEALRKGFTAGWIAAVEAMKEGKEK